MNAKAMLNGTANFKNDFLKFILLSPIICIEAASVHRMQSCVNKSENEARRAKIDFG